MFESLSSALYQELCPRLSFLVAKRLEYVPMSEPPRVRIISDNQQYSPYECTAEEVNIVGRVRWYGREM